jgi:hypothetical protein
MLSRLQDSKDSRVDVTPFIPGYLTQEQIEHTAPDLRHGVTVGFRTLHLQHRRTLQVIGAGVCREPRFQGCPDIAEMGREALAVLGRQGGVLWEDIHDSYFCLLVRCH